MDWNIFATIASPIIALFIGALLNWLILSREKVITHLGHVSTFRLAPSEKNPNPGNVHTHSLIIKNTGRKTAKNVRVGHQYFPTNIDVYPDTEYEME